MAKDSFILSQTRGGVGNLVVRRSNGKTIVSARPTSVSNPRTYAQAEVRMRLATVSKFYSPLSGYLQQGVQGKNTQNSMSAFSSAAIALMKEQGLSAPKEAEWWPLPFRLSKGSVAPLVFTPSFQAGALAVLDLPSVLSSDINTVGDFARMIKQNCAILVDKFQLTIVVAYRQALASDRFAFYHYVHRVFLDVSSTAAINTLSNERIVFPVAVVGDTCFLTIVGTAAYWPVGVALIISYWDGKKWVRSTSDLQIDADVLAEFKANYDANVATFMDSAATDPEGRVYLDGYTRRAGGDEPGIDWSAYAIAIGSSASTQKIASVGTGTLSDAQVIFVTLDNDQTYVLQGNDKMNAYGKAFRTDGGTKVTIPEGTSAVCVTSEPGYYDFYSAVADLFGLPVSYMFT